MPKAPTGAEPEMNVQRRRANLPQATKAPQSRSRYLLQVNSRKIRLSEYGLLSEDAKMTSRMAVARWLTLALTMLGLLVLIGAPSAMATTDTVAIEGAATQEAAAEDVEEAAAQAEEAEAAPLDAMAMRLHAKDRRGYVYKIHFLKHMIANALAKKMELRELPPTSKRRQVFLPEKREKLTAG